MTPDQPQATPTQNTDATPTQPVPGSPADTQKPLDPKSSADQKAAETRSKEFEEMMLRFSRTFTAEVGSKLDRLNELVGESHWLSVGNYKEAIIREQLELYTPSKYKVSTGFVLGEHPSGKKMMSRQIDILIWDASKYSPIFTVGDFVIIPPQACRVAIEVKGHLDHAALREGLENLESVSWFAEWAAQSMEGWIQTYLFAGEIDEAVTFPESILNSLHKMYLQIPYIEKADGSGVEQWSMTTAERANWSASGWGTTNWAAQWINGIAVMGKGVVGIKRLSFGSRENVPAYSVVDRPQDGHDNSFSFLKAMVLYALHNERNGENLYRARLYAKDAKAPAQREPFLLLPYDDSIADELDALNLSAKAYRPRGKRVWTPADAEADLKDKQAKKKKLAELKKQMYADDAAS